MATQKRRWVDMGDISPKVIEIVENSEPGPNGLRAGYTVLPMNKRNMMELRDTVRNQTRATSIAENALDAIEEEKKKIEILMQSYRDSLSRVRHNIELFAKFVTYADIVVMLAAEPADKMIAQKYRAQVEFYEIARKKIQDCFEF